MLKKLMKKEEGFTLAELLIVVAIIAVLTAIAIPVFTTQMEKSREATDMSNLRAAYAEVTSNFLTNGGQANSATVKLKQTSDNWQNTENGKLYYRVNGIENSISISAKKNGTVTISIDVNGIVSATTN